MEAGDGGSVVASASFPFEKLAGAGLGSRGDDTPEGWHAEQVGGPPLAAAGTGPSAPSAFGLGGLYPNPVQGGEVAVRLDLPARSAVTVRLFDVLGQEVLRLPPAVLEAGPARVMSLNVSGLSSGVYVYRVEVALAGGVEHASGRLTVVR